MRIVFYGTPDFAVPTLDALVQAGHEVVLVVAQPDKPAGRGNALRSPPVAERAKSLGLPLAQPKAVRSGPFPARIAALAPDVGVVVAFGRILTPELLAAPRFSNINVHASLLPRWRGAAPIHRAILAGDRTTGVCTQRMEEGLDVGPIYLCRETPIGPRETAGTLHDRLAAMSAAIAVDTLSLLPAAVPVPQAADGVTYAAKIDRSDGLTSLTSSAEAVDRQVRGCTPFPGAYLALASGNLKLLETMPRPDVDPGSAAPGEVLDTDPLVVATGAGALELVRVQLPDRKPVRGQDYANGLRLTRGDRVGDRRSAAGHD